MACKLNIKKYKLFGRDPPQPLKVFVKKTKTTLPRDITVEATTDMTSSTGNQTSRKPARNTAFSIHFVIKGAEKRRTMAYAKAKMLQSELGVVPHLVSVK